MHLSFYRDVRFQSFYGAFSLIAPSIYWDLYLDKGDISCAIRVAQVTATFIAVQCVHIENFWRFHSKEVGARHSEIAGIGHPSQSMNFYAPCGYVRTVPFGAAAGSTRTPIDGETAARELDAMAALNNEFRDAGSRGQEGGPCARPWIGEHTERREEWTPNPCGDSWAWRPHGDNSLGCCGPTSAHGPNLACSCGSCLATWAADCLGPNELHLDPVRVCAAPRQG